MRVVLQVQGDPQTWFTAESPIEDIELMSTGLASKIVVGFTPQFFGSLESSLGRAREIYDTVVSKISVIASLDPADRLAVIQDGSQTFSRLVKSDKFVELENRHIRQPQVGENTSDLYVRKFGHLLKYANLVEIVDQHFASNLTRNYSGAEFLLKRLLQDAKCSVRVHTQLYDSKKKQELALSLEKFVSEIGVRGRLEVVNYRPKNSAPFPHDRFGRFMFKRGQIGFTIGHGSELFGASRLKSASALVEIPVAFEELLRALEVADPDPAVNVY